MSQALTSPNISGIVSEIWCLEALPVLISCLLPVGTLAVPQCRPIGNIVVFLFLATSVNIWCGSYLRNI